ncbi:acyltransferase [Thermocladium modestius]|uniref:Acyltransferase n=1 Tax=Thermocladium modestius TaxID=62609 RepID=A0A830GVD8_9CREN|nr:acyltransferase [Thermocladium modestius]GGP20451.1 acyltransferase [Thermocladium modestius]
MYISRRANIRTTLVGDAVILGPSSVGEGSIIDRNVIIGYPIRSTLKKIGKMDDMDELSSGSLIGRNCVIRSGTVIYESSTLADDVETGHNVLIREKTVIGSGTRIGTATVIDGTVKIGSKVSIQSMVYIPIGSIIGNNVFIGPNVVITNDRYPPSKRLDGVIIEDNAAIGANSTLIAGIRVGSGSMVAAGSVVTKDVPPNVVVAGSPARVIYDRSTYLEKQRKYEAESKE